MSRYSDLTSCSSRERQQSSSSSHGSGYPEDDDESYLLKKYVKNVPKTKKFKRLSNVEIKRGEEAIVTNKRKKRGRKLSDIVEIYFRCNDNGSQIRCYFCNYKYASLRTNYLIPHLIRACPGVPPGIKQEFVKSVAGHKRRFRRQKYRKSSSTTTIELVPASTQDTNESNDNQFEVNVQEVLEEGATRVKTEKDEDCIIIGHKKNHEREMKLKQLELEKAKAETRKKKAAEEVIEAEVKIIQAKLEQENN